jgi:hypothetical protein
MKPTLPPLPLAAWRATWETLHLWTQVVGKVRLALAPPRNHWWHVTLRVSPRGLSTEFIPYGDGGFEAEFDLVGHGLEVRTSRGDVGRFGLRDGLSVAAFHRRFFELLGDFGIRARIQAKPYGVAFSHKPFAKDETHAAYDRDAVERFASVLRWSAGAFETFAGGYEGKTSPVQFFWHSGDLAVTRFSGRRAPKEPSFGPVEREAYSCEVASFGFWPGDEQVPRPSYYSYAAPMPEGYMKEPLRPRPARWNPAGGNALLDYDAVRAAKDPRAALLAFFESAFRAARTRARWDAVLPR